jgi:glucokinase
MSNTDILGIDIGGSHITVALIDLENKAIVPGTEKRCFVDPQGTADEILNSWCAVINEVFITKMGTQKRIGIAMPGPFDYEAGISLIYDQDKFRSLYKLNLKQELASRLGMEADDFIFSNDAAAFLQGEVFCGAAMNCDPVLGLTLGTGLGAALSTDMEAEDAALWNMPFKQGIAEDYLSTRWFLKSYLELTGTQLKGVKELVALKNSSPEVQQLFDQFADNLAEFIQLAAAKVTFSHVVLGGNIANAYAAFLPLLMKGLEDKNCVVTVKVAMLQEQAALIGAASRFRKLYSTD